MRTLLILLAGVAFLVGTISSTGASFSASQSNSGNTYAAKADWIAPAVTLTDPGAYLRGTASLAATATDAGSGVQSVTISRSPAGAGTWTAICTTTVSPYGCSLDTTAGATPDGLYDFRASAIDNAGNAAASATVANRRIDNTAPTSVAMTDPGSPLAGTRSLAGTATDAGSGVATLAVQYKPSAGSTWTTACTASASPYSCSFNTTAGATPDGLYDFRVIATDNAGNSTTSSAVTSRRIDNTAPTGVTMTDPAPSGFISGTKAFSGAATDAGSGVATVEFQYRPAAGGLWLDACTATTSPYGCSADTTLITDGQYDFRALATDVAGNATASAIFTSRRIDNTPPTVTMNDPGAFIRGTISATAAAADGGGIASVVIQYRTTPAGAWTTICTDTTSPYSCPLNTTTLTTGTDYDFQAIATDNASRVTTSAAVTSRMVDNANPTSATFTNPGTPLSGTVTLSGAGADANSGVATVTMQYSPAGAGTWSTACVASTSPYSCAFDTTTVGDAVYDLRSLVTDRAGNTLASITAANIRIDNLAPTVTMTDPGANLRGTITPGATAADGGGIANVKIEYRTSPSGAWTAICIDTTSPYSCSLNTTTLTDGLYDFRATATDNASRVTVSSVVSGRRVDNTAPTGVTMTDPGSPLTGNVAFTGTALDTGGSGIASVQYEYLLFGFIWTTMCTATTSPYTCTADTSTITDGSYSMRAVATDNAGNTTTSATIASRRIDNTPPTVTMGDPGPLTGTETLTATAADGSGAGVTSVTIQYKLTSGSTWADVCTDTTSPYSCTLDSTTLPENEHYDFRAIAVDGAGFTTTSAVVASRIVDNTAPTVTMTDPGSPIRGSVTLASTPADSGSGIASVLYQYKLSSGSTWTTACTASTTPWSCAWASTGVADGSYDVRAIATDVAGLQTTSAAVNARIVDNSSTPTGTDVQTANGGATAGKAEVSDSITFTFSEPIAPASILSGWDGTSTSVVVRIDDFTTTPFDRLTVWNSTDAAQTALTAANGVRLGGDYVPASGVKFNATMVMSGSTVTVTFTSVRSGGVNATAALNGTMQWSPSASATDLAGHAVGTGVVNETGVSDKEF